MNKDALCGDIWELVEVMKKLRAPDGCPWDRKQTHESLMPYIMEECAVPALWLRRRPKRAAP